MKCTFLSFLDDCLRIGSGENGTNNRQVKRADERETKEFGEPSDRGEARRGDLQTFVFDVLAGSLFTGYHDE